MWGIQKYFITEQLEGLEGKQRVRGVREVRGLPGASTSAEGPKRNGENLIY